MMEKVFTREKVLLLLRDGDKSLPQMREALGCSQATIENLLRYMLDAKMVVRRNVGTEKKPFYIYSALGRAAR